MFSKCYCERVSHDITPDFCIYIQNYFLKNIFLSLLLSKPLSTSIFFRNKKSQKYFKTLKVIFNLQTIIILEFYAHINSIAYILMTLLSCRGGHHTNARKQSGCASPPDFDTTPLSELPPPLGGGHKKLDYKVKLYL